MLRSPNCAARPFVAAIARVASTPASAAATSLAASSCPRTLVPQSAVERRGDRGQDIQHRLLAYAGLAAQLHRLDPLAQHRREIGGRRGPGPQGRLSPCP